ncbi:cyclic-di-AMP receptor [Effusibacillus pohliae]|uniref:cyclic-di-AMP receptor n=1 Tax=Effusibacillus pohliae TaxID=232270 RepID=UPI00036267C9|nr:cyclic-di-AMP receptor [Effusibacillus pohliae]
MRLIIAVVQDKDSVKLSDRLVKAGIRATKLASTGGFLKSGNSTFLIGVEQEKVDEVLDIIRQSCRAREQLVSPMSPVGNQIDSYVPYPVSVQVGGATVFVLDVEKYEHY